MINSNDRTKDSEDVGVLFHALIRYVGANEDRLDVSVTCAGYGKLLELASSAATEIALHHRDEGDNWDGVIWFERLESIGEDSLAKSLFFLESDVTSIVKAWLLSLN